MFNLRQSWKVVIAAVGLLGAATFANDAAAAPIGNASFGIGGAFSIPAGTHFGTTDSIFISNGGMIVVTAGDSMDLAGLINLGDTGTLQDLPSISGFTPISSYLNIGGGGGVSIDLNSLTLISQSGPTPGFINMAGDVTIHAPGYDATNGQLTFSGTSSDNSTFTLAITTSAQTSGVPEPLSILILGLGLLTLLFGLRGAHQR